MNDTKQKECPACDGTGSQQPEGCARCGSDGWVDDPKDGGTMNCPDCKGLSGQPCDAAGCEDGVIYYE